VSAPLLAGEATRTRHSRVYAVAPRPAFSAWYELFSRSQARAPVNTARSPTRQRLPEIAALGFDVLYLPPIHPNRLNAPQGPEQRAQVLPGDPGTRGRSVAKKVGKPRSTPSLGTLADFEVLSLPRATSGWRSRSILRCSARPNHPWLKEHPEWFFIRPDGTIATRNPPRIRGHLSDQFLCKDRQGLWDACRDVVLFLDRPPASPSSVDNPHTSAEFWEWLIRDVQAAHSGTIFHPSRSNATETHEEPGQLGFSQSYTIHLKNSAWERRDYLRLTRTDMRVLSAQFLPNTPDILHESCKRAGGRRSGFGLLLAADPVAQLMQLSGYELCENAPVHHGSERILDSEKYQIRVRDWNAPGNIKQVSAGSPHSARAARSP